jgi:hypothetical protein
MKRFPSKTWNPWFSCTNTYLKNYKPIHEKDPD